ncbi:MAG: glycosyltransferase family 4 protein [Planctomycetes bacterium]|nr:glycosyltransferase family 4 protein [Planctomycetota bacterium]
MRVLMLGWEYPPHISGGLGTACEGLTRALSQEGVDVTFIVPRAFGDEDAGHMNLVSPQNAREVVSRTVTRKRKGPDSHRDVESIDTLEMIEVDSILRPYQTPESYETRHTEFRTRRRREIVPGETTIEHEDVEFVLEDSGSGQHYGDDLYAEVRRYADLTGQLAERIDFDLIHAHDWMTYPAGLEARRRTGKPLVVHVHSLEFDRSGEHVNEGIHRIEGAGINGADRVIAVSHYTKAVAVKQHGVDPSMINVVHNGVTRAEGLQRYHLEPAPDAPPMVLFLGRVTYQKGPEFFVRAAQKVLTRAPRTRFVMAGSGDMLESMKKLARQLGIFDSFEFPGFVRGAELERIFTMADVYVMPSRSEPFGISPLEAMAYDTPVIVSRQSGVSEVLRHALKVDYWDVDRMAQLILAVVRHQSLSNEMLEMGTREVLQLHWKAAAQKVVHVYHEVLGQSPVVEELCYPF